MFSGLRLRTQLVLCCTKVLGARGGEIVGVPAADPPMAVITPLGSYRSRPDMTLVGRQPQGKALVARLPLPPGQGRRRGRDRPTTEPVPPAASSAGREAEQLRAPSRVPSELPGVRGTHLVALIRPFKRAACGRTSRCRLCERSAQSRLAFWAHLSLRRRVWSSRRSLRCAPCISSVMWQRCRSRDRPLP
jgi:hypothetical protein